jgi:hypothetical protein
MSYDSDLFEINVSDEFKCSICLCVLKEPSQLNCEHLFCRQCILTFLQRTSQNTQFCPLDMKPAKVADIKPAHKSISNIISKMDVKCRNYTNGCKKKMKLENLDEHDAHCEYNPCVPSNRRATPAPEVVTFSVIVQLVDSRTTTISCKANDTVLMFKRKIQEKEGISVEEQSLVFGTKVLEDNKDLIHYNFYNNCFVYSTRRFKGGN